MLERHLPLQPRPQEPAVHQELHGRTSKVPLASFAATCTDNKVNFKEWLADVLYRPASCPRSLLPLPRA